ncbi:MAG: hypothetical protein ACJAX5_001170 [Patiriisocius sp.]|jgi:hypothetical protein
MADLVRLLSALSRLPKSNSPKHSCIYLLIIKSALFLCRLMITALTDAAYKIPFEPVKNKI